MTPCVSQPFMKYVKIQSDFIPERMSGSAAFFFMFDISLVCPNALIHHSVIGRILLVLMFDASHIL